MGVEAQQTPIPKILKGDVLKLNTILQRRYSILHYLPHVLKTVHFLNKIKKSINIFISYQLCVVCQQSVFFLLGFSMCVIHRLLLIAHSSLKEQFKLKFQKSSALLYLHIIYTFTIIPNPYDLKHKMRNLEQSTSHMRRPLVVTNKTEIGLFAC